MQGRCSSALGELDSEGSAMLNINSVGLDRRGTYNGEYLQFDLLEESPVCAVPSHLR